MHYGEIKEYEHDVLNGRFIVEKGTNKEYKDGTLSSEGEFIICKSYPFYGIAPHIDGYEGECKELNYVGEVYYSDEECAFFVELKAISDRVSGRAIGSMLSEYEEDIEKYGTIHDNPTPNA
jgi:hypothetical protein